MKIIFKSLLLLAFISQLFVSCIKNEDEVYIYERDTLVNELPYNIFININQEYFYLQPSERKECLCLKQKTNGGVTLNAFIAYKGSYINMDSMIDVSEYTLKSVTKKIKKKGGECLVNYYTISENVFSDIITTMANKGVKPTAYNENIFKQIGTITEINKCNNISSYDIAIGEKDVIQHNTTTDFATTNNQDAKRLTLNCILYYKNITDGNSYSLQVSNYDWSIAATDSKSDGLDKTVTYSFNFTDELLENIKEFMAAKNVFSQITVFPQ
ncbi:MAG: hypothetical protein II939_02455 [Bacteroidales bacterium]|nr:hypothetical protein [Bacteroidales bacterium]